MTDEEQIVVRGRITEMANNMISIHNRFLEDNVQGLVDALGELCVNTQLLRWTVLDYESGQ